MKIVFVTGNQHKIDEAQAILPHFEIVGKKLDLAEIQGTPDLIVKAKAREAAALLGKPVIVDDSGVFIEAFNGFPGAYAANYQNTVGNERTITMLQGFDNRKIRYECRAAYCEPGQEPVVFIGIVEGTVAKEVHGREGFGFDPIFIPNGHDKTFVELGKEIKNTMSHRTFAFQKLATWLEANK